jgi:hypothetical protein
VAAVRDRDRKLPSFQYDELVGRLVVAGRLRRSAFGVPVRDLRNVLNTLFVRIPIFLERAQQPQFVPDFYFRDTFGFLGAAF